MSQVCDVGEGAPDSGLDLNSQGDSGRALGSLSTVFAFFTGISWSQQGVRGKYRPSVSLRLLSLLSRWAKGWDGEACRPIFVPSRPFCNIWMPWVNGLEVFFSSQTDSI